MKNLHSHFCCGFFVKKNKVYEKKTRKTRIILISNKKISELSVIWLGNLFNTCRHLVNLSLFKSHSRHSWAVKGSFTHTDGGRGFVSIHYHKGAKSKWLLSRPMGYKQPGVHSQWAPVERYPQWLLSVIYTGHYETTWLWPWWEKVWPLFSWMARLFTDNCKMSEDSPVICLCFKCFLDTLETMATLN